MELDTRQRSVRAFRPVVRAVLTACCLLTVRVIAQEPAPQREPDDDSKAAAARLTACARRAQALLQKGDQAGARAECERALQPTDLKQVSAAWLEATMKPLRVLGFVAHESGAVELSHDVWTTVVRHFAATLPEDHDDLQRARMNLAVTTKARGDLRGALELEQQVLAVRTRQWPEDHPDLQMLRGNLAATLFQLGDRQGALVLQEQVLAVRMRTLPEEDPAVHLARTNLALTKDGLGDRKGAIQLLELVVTAHSRTLPPDDLRLQKARLSLADVKKRDGDLHGALALEEAVLASRTRTLPERHADLQAVRLHLASTLYSLGRLDRARTLGEQVVAAYAETLPEDHPDLQLARTNLALTRSALGELVGAHELQEKVVAALSGSLPEDHRDVQVARLRLAGTKRSLGDLRGALELEEGVLAVLSRTLPDADKDLQAVRCNLAVTKKQLGDLRGALALEQQMLTIAARVLPDDHADLQTARHNLAVTLMEMGELGDALALQERVLAVRSRTLRADHPDLQRARQNLAISKKQLGDLHGAQALEQQVLALYAKTLPPDHPDVLAARGNLAVTKFHMGDLSGALELQEQILAVRSRALPDDHPSLLSIRQNIAATRLEMGDLQGARALHEQVVASRSRSLPEDSPRLLLARYNLAAAEFELGDVRGSMVHCEQVLAALSRNLPEGHPELLNLRASLARMSWAAGDLPGAAASYRATVAAVLVRLAGSVVSSRDAVQLAIAVRDPVSHIGSFLDFLRSSPGEVALSADLVSSLTRQALTLLLATRGVQGLAIDRLRAARSEAGDQLASLLTAVAIANKALDEALVLPTEGRIDGKGQRISRADAVRDATLAKDAAERALLATVPAELRALPTLDAITAGLAPTEAAIAFLTYRQCTPVAGKPWLSTEESRFAAFVLGPSGAVSWHSLASVDAVARQIVELRAAAAVGQRLAARTSPGTALAGPGRDPEPPSSQSDGLASHLTALRDLLFAPLLDSLPEGTKTVVVSPADEMLLVPIEQLPLGEVLTLRIVPDLFTLVRSAVERPEAPTSLVLGGADYDATPVVPSSVEFVAVKPIAATRDSPDPDAAGDSEADSGEARSHPATGAFAQLPGADLEAQQIGDVFRAAFDNRAPTVLRGAAASEAAFIAQAKGKTFLHLATHGYFAPESAWRSIGASEQGPLARFDLGREDQVAQLSPFSLTGIALAGANLPPDLLGRLEGTLTAQEVTELDLTGCYLATLSACNTSLGVSRGGTGLASLRQAFHAAGARFVLATLWEVDDTHAAALMVDLYMRMWRDGKDPRVALRAAQRAAEARGVPFRDWAGWMITGR